jgi:hypothetical protein
VWDLERLFMIEDFPHHLHRDREDLGVEAEGDKLGF